MHGNYTYIFFWCHAPQTLKNASKIKEDTFLSPLIFHPLKLTYLSIFCPLKQHPGIYIYIYMYIYNIYIYNIYIIL